MCNGVRGEDHAPPSRESSAATGKMAVIGQQLKQKQATETTIGPRAPELSVVVPTFNECENIEQLVRRLEHALTGVAWEVIFVDDDSADETAELVRRITLSSPYMRVLHRIGRRGLSSACVEGMLSSSAPYLAVMDADLQHEERLLHAPEGGGPRGLQETLRRRLQDLAVHIRLCEAALGLRGDSLHLSRPPRWREQARKHGRLLAGAQSPMSASPPTCSGANFLDASAGRSPPPPAFSWAPYGTTR